MVDLEFLQTILLETDFDRRWGLTYGCDEEGLMNTIYKMDLKLEKAGGRVGTQLSEIVASRCYQPEWSFSGYSERGAVPFDFVSWILNAGSAWTNIGKDLGTCS